MGSTSKPQHWQECRDRCYEMFRGSAKVKNQEARMKEFEKRQEQQRGIEESDRAGATARNFVETGNDQGSGSASSSSGIRVVSQGSDEGLAVQWVREIQQVVKDNLGDGGDEPNGEEDWGLGDEAVDDVNGGPLPVGLVKEARREEADYINPGAYGCLD